MGRPSSGNVPTIAPPAGALLLQARRRRASLAALVLALCSTAGAGGCAHDVLIRSEPAGAKIYVDGKLEGEAPVIVEQRTSMGGRMRVTAQLDNFETTETIVQTDEWFPWPGIVAVTPLVGLPFVVIPFFGPFICGAWMCATSPTLLSLAFLRKYPAAVTVTLRPKVGAGLILPTDGWMIPDGYAPNPPPPRPDDEEPQKQPPPPRPPQPEGANPVP